MRLTSIYIHLENLQSDGTSYVNAAEDVYHTMHMFHNTKDETTESFVVQHPERKGQSRSLDYIMPRSLDDR